MARRAGEESLHRERHRKAGEEHRGRDAPAKLVKSIGGETPPLPGQSAPPLSQHNHRAQSSSALPPSTSVASARRRGGPRGRREVSPRKRHCKAGEEQRGRDAAAPRGERTVAKSAHPHSSRAIRTLSFNERSECPEEGWPGGPGRSLCPQAIRLLRCYKRSCLITACWCTVQRLGSAPSCSKTFASV